MLVLLIIFMVAAPLATVSIRLDLPPATPPTPTTEQKDPVYITIQDTGSIFIAEQQTTIETLAADVCAALGGGDPGCKEERVFVRAQPEVKYNAFMEVMNDLQTQRLLQGRPAERRHRIGSSALHIDQGRVSQGTRPFSFAGLSGLGS